MMRVSCSDFGELCHAGMVTNPYIFKTTPSRKNKSAIWICGGVSKGSGIVLSVDDGGSEIKHVSVANAVSFLTDFGFKKDEISFWIPEK